MIWEDAPVEGSIIRRRLDAPARREEIIRAAAGFFAEVGFGGSTRELAQRAGVTQALLYKYFASKAELREAVFDRVYLGRIAPHWLPELRDRDVPLHRRLCRFYGDYTRAIFTYEWMRIFMWAGLDGDALNRRYLDHLSEVLLIPMREEIRAEAALHTGSDRAAPSMEDVWNLHGGIIYLGIRRHIYHLPVPEDVTPVIEAAVERFLSPRTA